jgi:hypothetical protein
MTELATPSLFEEACERVTEDEVAEAIVCGPDASRHIEKLNAYREAGFDHVYIHQVGQDQEGFFRFYRQEVLPNTEVKG